MFETKPKYFIEFSMKKKRLLYLFSKFLERKKKRNFKARWYTEAYLWTFRLMPAVLRIMMV